MKHSGSCGLEEVLGLFNRKRQANYICSSTGERDRLGSRVSLGGTAGGSGHAAVRWSRGQTCTDVAGFQLAGRSSAIWVMFIAGRRRRTSVRYAWGLMPRRRQLTIRE